MIPFTNPLAQGERRARVTLENPKRDGKVKAKKEDVAAVRKLLAQFLAHQAPSVGTAKDLAVRMAGLAHFMGDAEDPAGGGAHGHLAGLAGGF